MKQRFSFLQLKYGDLYSVLDAVKVMILLVVILLLYARQIMSLTVCHVIMDVSAPWLNFEPLALSKKTVAASCKGIQDSLGFCIWDCRYLISVSVNKAWILDSNHKDSRFLELYF